MLFARQFLVGLLVVFAALPSAAADLSVEVVIETAGNNDPENDPVLIAPKHPFSFFVVLTNNTDHHLGIWKDWCSYGYFNLSFDFVGKDGKVVHVEKGGQFWTINSPDMYDLDPGKHFVLTPVLEPDTNGEGGWINTGGLAGTMTVKAIYQCTRARPPDLAATDPKFKDAWAGKIESEPVQVSFKRED
jgi:hypothetical protein